MRTIDVIGTPLAVTTYAGLIATLQDLLRSGGVWSVDFSNTQIVTKRRHEPHFKAITDNVDYFIPDGMPLIWCLNSRGAALTDRVYGPKFMAQCIAQSPAPYKHYLLGGTLECLAMLRDRLVRENPGICIAGSHHGYFQENEEARVLREIEESRPDFIWVGLGTPKQQEWINRNKTTVSRGILLAVGFAFDVIAGTKPDAPGWMQNLGLTWVFRLVSEPRRLAWRYLRYNTLFIFYLFKDALMRRSTP